MNMSKLYAAFYYSYFYFALPILCQLLLIFCQDEEKGIDYSYIFHYFSSINESLRTKSNE